MKNILGIIGLFVAIVCIALSCKTEEINSALDSDETVADTVTLMQGKTIALPSGEQLTFDHLVEDSRCPANAMCIWQGMVTIEMSVVAGSKKEAFTFTTNPQEPITSLTVLGYNITLANVFPYPGTSLEEVQESDYYLEATIVKTTH